MSSICVHFWQIRPYALFWVQRLFFLIIFVALIGVTWQTKIIWFSTKNKTFLSYPSQQKVHDIEQIQQVQRRFNKRLPGLKMLSYTARLSGLNIPNLELRRLHTDLITCYKTAFSFADVKSNDFFSLALLRQDEAISINCLRNTVMLMLENFLVSASLMYRIVCHQRLLILVHSVHIKRLLNS